MLRKFKFPEEEKDVIDKLRKCLRDKVELARSIADLEQKIASTLDESFYWDREKRDSPPKPKQAPYIKCILKSVGSPLRSGSPCSSTTKSSSHLEQIDESKEPCESLFYRKKLPPPKSRFNRQRE